MQLVSDTAGMYLSVFKSENIDNDLWPKALCFIHVLIMLYVWAIGACAFSTDFLKLLDWQS